MRARQSAIALVSLFVVGGCDLTVSNPGPVRDGALDDPGSHPALITGMTMQLSRALTLVSFVGADAAKEYTQGGRGHPIKLPVAPGQLTVDGIADLHWNAAQQARWLAEDGIRRLREQLDDDFNSSMIAAHALLHAGFANRLLAENVCEGVIDGGPVQSHDVYLQRAEGHFTGALTIAFEAGADIELAARAGRASVRLLQGRYEAAAADAGLVPDDYSFQALYSVEREELYNFVYYISSNAPWRAHSVVDTYYEDYYDRTGDPRVSWARDPATPQAEFAAVPWLYQTKYTARNASVNLSSGREMRLIEAESALQRGDGQGAMSLINELRTSITSDHTGQPLPPLAAADLEDAWTHLKRERGIELWLEGRRMGDLRRWITDATPGAMEDVSDRVRLCIPIPEGERRTNENIDFGHKDPKNPLYTGDLQ